MTALEHRPWIVRVLIYAVTGILLILAGAIALMVLGAPVWALMEGPLWLRWAVGVPLALILLTLVGRNFYRERL